MHISGSCLFFLRYGRTIAMLEMKEKETWKRNNTDNDNNKRREEGRGGLEKMSDMHKKT